MAILGLIKRVTLIARTSSRVRVYPARYFQSRNLSVTNSLNCEDSKLPVLIVGAGPVGLVLSILLTKLGIECGVVDKATSFSKHPQAHFINNRSMEIFRKLDGLAEEIERGVNDDEDEDNHEHVKFIIEDSIAGFKDEPSIQHDVYPESDVEDDDERNQREQQNVRRGHGNLFHGQTFFNKFAFMEAVLDHALQSERNIRQY